MDRHDRAKCLRARRCYAERAHTMAGAYQRPTPLAQPLLNDECRQPRKALGTRSFSFARMSNTLRRCACAVVVSLPKERSDWFVGLPLPILPRELRPWEHPRVPDVRTILRACWVVKRVMTYFLAVTLVGVRRALRQSNSAGTAHVIASLIGSGVLPVRSCCIMPLCRPFTPSGLIFCPSGRLSARM